MTLTVVIWETAVLQPDGTWEGSLWRHGDLPAQWGA